MGVDEWVLVACVVFSGVWSGLLAMLTLVMHPMLERMDGAGFARFLGAFLPVARKAPINYAAVAGPLLVSNRLAEPNYDVILAWDPDRLPAGWEGFQRKYYAYNWIRAAATWVAFALFLAALVDVLN